MDDADVVRIDERDEYTIRTFAEDDRADVERLASEGLLVGHVNHSDSATEADPHGSGAGYPTPHSFWVVEAQGHVIGTIAMLDGDPDVGQLLQLRVAPAWRNDPRIAKCLVSAAVECAKERGVLKVVIESPGLEPQRSGGEGSSIVTYLRSLGFEYTRTREERGRSMLEFYLNLYQEFHGTS
jgi:N-acetylglutamate synthase-like GNAT family acetyltransferase